MSSVKKLKDSDATAEFEIPESIIKKEKELKGKSRELSEAIDQAKSEKIVRQVDESTRIYNLRQIKLKEIIEDLEQKKNKIEQDLRSLMHKKSLIFHADIKKVTDSLFQETKKITDLDKDISSGVTKISSIKNEMQLLFENSREDRKKHGDALSEQNKEIQKIALNLRQALEQLRLDQHEFQQNINKTNEEITHLYQKKTDLTLKVHDLLEEQTRLEKINSDLLEKAKEKEDLDEEIKLSSQKVEEINEITSKKIDLQKDVDNLKKKKFELEIVIKDLTYKRQELDGQTSRKELFSNELEEQINNKKNTLARISEETLDAKKELENYRSNLLEIQRDHRQELAKLDQIQKETAKLEGEKTALINLFEDAQKNYLQRNEDLKKEISLTEENFKKERECLDRELENHKLELQISLNELIKDIKREEERHIQELEERKMKWKEEFEETCNQQSQKYLQSLEENKVENINLIRSQKKKIINEFISVVESYLKRNTSKTDDEKLADIKKKYHEIFDRHFGKAEKWKLW